MFLIFSYYLGYCRRSHAVAATNKADRNVNFILVTHKTRQFILFQLFSGALSRAQKSYSATNVKPASHIYEPGRDLETARPITSVTTETLALNSNTQSAWARQKLLGSCKMDSNVLLVSLTHLVLGLFLGPKQAKRAVCVFCKHSVLLVSTFRQCSLYLYSVT